MSTVYYVAYHMPIAHAIIKLEKERETAEFITAHTVLTQPGRQASMTLKRVLNGRRQVFDSFMEARIALVAYHEQQLVLARVKLVEAQQNLVAAQQVVPKELE